MKPNVERTSLSNGSRLSCGRRADRRKAPACSGPAPGKGTADSLKGQADSFKRMLGCGLFSRADSDRCTGLDGCDDWNHLEIDEVVPVAHPFIEQCALLALHDLEAAAEITRDPAVHVG